MKISKSLLPIAAVLSVAAGLITAVPAHAAVVLPAGCTTDPAVESKADVGWIDCPTLASGADFSGFTGLHELYIGDAWSEKPSKISITKLPKMPPTLERLGLNAPKITDYSGLAGVKNLSVLDITYPSSRLNLSSVAKWNPQLEELTVNALKGAVDARPLAKLKKLSSLELLGILPNIRLNEGSWTSVAFPKALNGQAVLPSNYNFTDDNGKPISTKFYNFDAKTSKIRMNSAFVGDFSSIYRSSKPTAAQPRLKHVQITFGRAADVAGKSEWAKDTKMKLVFRGKAQVGKTVTAQLSNTSNPFKAYVDAWQWYRNGKAIKGATKASYKLVGADVGKKITVKATDNKDEFGFAWFRTVPHSVTITATHKAQYGFAVHKPYISGTARSGKVLTAKFKKWGGSPTRYSYQWYRNGKAIKSATRATYKATNADKGRKLTVKVTGSKKNYQTASSTSSSKTMNR